VVAGDRAGVGASTAGERGREVGNELTGGVGGTEREAGARARGRRRQAWPTRQREGGRGRTCETDGPPVSAGGCARMLDRLGLNGPNWGFLISGNF
jgi:hypothetical protein